jgi:hypothetical protein
MDEPGAQSGSKRWFAGWGGGSKKLQTETRRCPNGHPMAQDWVECPYCEANARNKVKTTRPSTPPAPPPRSEGPAYERRATEPLGAAPPEQRLASSPPPWQGSGQGGGQRPMTSVWEAPAPGASPAQQGHNVPGGHRIRGVIYSFSWSNVGELFVIRDGRNFIGRSTVAAEGDRDCDVQIPDDKTMSSVHFMILCQADRIQVKDQNSVSGTHVDGELIDTVGIELRDGAIIKAGNTLFAFQKVTRPDAAPSPGRAERREEAPPEQPPRHKGSDETPVP